MSPEYELAITIGDWLTRQLGGWPWEIRTGRMRNHGTVEVYYRHQYEAAGHKPSPRLSVELHTHSILAWNRTVTVILDYTDQELLAKLYRMI